MNFFGLSAGRGGGGGVEFDGTTTDALDGRPLLVLILLLASTLGIRLIGLDQPVVENYVGRQVPTAMVARNLDRGSGFLRPQLDTGPFPNYFVVEPPLYEQLVVWIKRVGTLSLSESGRLLSAAGITLAAWGLFDLARRREGMSVALLSVLAFSAFPVTIRFGRAFQPDALMLGLVVLGLSWWGRGSNGGLMTRVVGWLMLALGLALKITSAYILVPLVACLGALAIGGRAGPTLRWRARLILACSMLLPALAWYLWANHLVNSGDGSRASADNREIWLQVLAPTVLFTAQVWRSIGRFFLWRCFTPLGPVLAIIGFGCVSSRGSRDRLWPVWGISAAAALLVLAAKLHHEYYWLALAPVLAVGIGRGLVGLEHRFRGAGWIGGAVFLGLCGFQARSTWETPPEWTHLEAAGRVVRQTVPPDAWVVAPEALLFQAERRGCRLETSPRGCRRAAGEWGKQLPHDTAIDLVEMYRAQKARYFADLGASPDSRADDEARRVALHEAIRRRYKVIVDLPAILLAELQ
jgi:4-amino-4-deoxy-L-arabinose transferase-like glycosyltransferase